MIKTNNIQLVKVDQLKHIEGFGPKRVNWLAEKIIKDGAWINPLKIEINHFLVMDGQHRMEVAKKIGLSKVPCALFDYNEVEVWSLRKNHIVTPELIISKALSNNIYPYKTAKHKFPDRDKTCYFPLKELGYCLDQIA